MKLKIFLLSATVVAHAGFFSNDLKYYETHLDDAKEKFDECKKAFQHALIDRDQDKIKEIQQDSECIDSEKAIKAAKRREWEAKIALEEKERKEKEAKDKKLFEEKKKEYLSTFKEMPYVEFIEVEDDNRKCRFYRHYGDIYTPKDAKCVAWKELHKSKKEKAFSEINNKYPKEKLLEYKNKVCKNTSSWLEQGSPECELARDVYKERIKKEVANYLAHKDLLKKDYNECMEKYKPLYLNGEYGKAQKVENSYKCKMAAEAAYELGVFFSNLQSMK